MAKYSREELVEMAYLYLVEGMIQSDIEDHMDIPKGTVSSQLKPYGITGYKNVRGGGGYGKKGNHCGIASFDRIGFEVTRQDIYEFMFGGKKWKSDIEFLNNLKAQKTGSSSGSGSQTSSGSSGNNSSQNEEEYVYYREPGLFERIFASVAGLTGYAGAIVFLIVLFFLGSFLRGVGVPLIAKIGWAMIMIVKIAIAAVEGIFTYVMVTSLLQVGRKTEIIIVLALALIGLATIFLGGNIILGAIIWGAGIVVGLIRSA